MAVSRQSRSVDRGVDLGVYLFHPGNIDIAYKSVADPEGRPLVLVL